MLKSKVASDLTLLLKNAVNSGCDTIKIFDGAPNVAYLYKGIDSPYSSRCNWTNEIKDQDDFLEFKLMVKVASAYLSSIKTCTLTKKTNGFRIRFADEVTKEERMVLAGFLEMVLARSLENYVHVNKKCETESNTGIVASLPPIPVMAHKPCTPCNNLVLAEKQKGKVEKMNDFSFSNLKDALVRKITTLDKKTITILGIIVLLLLIATRYQDIKDILIGIKNKVVKSKNYKAMVEDGTNALNSLKKIVGVKAEAENE